MVSYKGKCSRNKELIDDDDKKIHNTTTSTIFILFYNGNGNSDYSNHEKMYLEHPVAEGTTEQLTNTNTNANTKIQVHKYTNTQIQ